MSNDVNGGGLGALLAGLGFAGILLLPVILMRWLGVRVMSVLVAVAATGFAIAHPSIVEWTFAERAYCTGTLCPADALYNAITVIPTGGWWAATLVAWFMVIWTRRDRPGVQTETK